MMKVFFLSLDVHNFFSEIVNATQRNQFVNVNSNEK